jgi:ClpP class serine protease
MSARAKRRPQPRRATVPPVEEEPSQAEVAVQPAAGAMLPPPEEVLSLIHRLQDLRDSRMLTFVCRPDVTMRGDVVEQVYEQLREIGRVPRIDLFLHSAGGQTEIPWRLITLIRDFGERFSVLIPAMAYSAATHLAMGADEIVMGPLSELSPVDPARSHPLLPSRKEGEPVCPTNTS